MTCGWGELIPGPDMSLTFHKITRHCREYVAHRTLELAMTRNKKVTATHKARSFQMTDGLFTVFVRDRAK